MPQDQIVRETEIDAPPGRVWDLLTDPVHLAAWFAFDGAEIDLRPGGAMVLRWKEHGTFHAVVERVEPLQLFAYRWSLRRDEQVREGNSTLVEFTLDATERGTRLRVVESGFASLDGSAEERAAHLADNSRGWSGGFGLLAELAVAAEAQ